MPGVPDRASALPEYPADSPTITWSTVAERVRQNTVNRFELMLAPPSLTPRALKNHIDTYPEKDSAAVLETCRRELVDVTTRLTDELTTVRFPRQLRGPVPRQPSAYREFCERAIGSNATPIDYCFFAPFLPADVDARKAAAWVDALSDPYHLQAWAAQALRVAVHAEAENPTLARVAWLRALELYQRYFATAGVEDSFTFQRQTEPRCQQECRKVWENFLPGQVAALAERALAYASAHKTRAFQACLEALAEPAVAGVNTVAARRATDQAYEAVIAGIASATSFEDAAMLYEALPKADPVKQANVDQALLRAMAKEALLVSDGGGNVLLLETCARHVGLPCEDDEPVDALTWRARDGFYNACSTAALEVNRMSWNTTPKSTQDGAVRLLRLLPANRTIGWRTDSHEAVKRDWLIKSLTFFEWAPEISSLRSEFTQCKALEFCSARMEKMLNDLIEYANQNAVYVLTPTDPLGVVCLVKFTLLDLATLGHDGDQERRERMMEAIRGFLPLDCRVYCFWKKEERTIQGWIDYYYTWRDQARSESPATYSVEPEPTPNSPDVEPPSPTDEPPVTTVVEPRTTPSNLFWNDKELTTLLLRLSRVRPTSLEAEEALDDVLRYFSARHYSAPGHELLSLPLVPFFGKLARAYIDDPYSNSRCVVLMARIAVFLPSTTRAWVGGTELTLREHVDALDEPPFPQSAGGASQARAGRRQRWKWWKR